MKIERVKLWALLASVAVTGCHTFVPTDRSALEPGQSVRVQIRADVAANQVETLGDFKESLDGTVLRLEESTLGLTVTPAEFERAGMARDLRTFVELPWEGVQSIQARKFSWGRSILVAAGGAAAAWGILELTTGGSGGEGEGGNVNNGLVSLPIFGFVF